MGLFQPTLDIRANQRFYIKCPDGVLVIPPGNTFPEKIEEGSQVKPSKGDGVWRWIYNRYQDEFLKRNILFKTTDTSPLVTSEGKQSKWNIYTKIWLKDRQERGKLPLDMFDRFENRHSAQELNNLEIPFDFAKPSELIAYLVGISNVKNNDIVLDFFSGSATTAHAILDFNKESNSNRKYIMIQLPEPCEEDSEAYKAGYKNIAEIGKGRVRRVINKIKGERATKSAEAKESLPGIAKEYVELDLGFRVFKLDKSNFNIWDGTVSKDGDIEGQLELAINHIDADSSDEDILYEILLKAGFELTTKIQELNLVGKKVYSIADNALLICLERNLTKEVITEMARLQPARVVCLDAGFADNDQLKTNAVQIMKSHSIEDFRTV